MSSIITVLASFFNIPVKEFSTNVQGNIELQDLIPDFTRQVEHCYTSPGFTDPDLGTFTAEYSSSCVMPSRCAPEKPENINVKFLLFLRQHPSKVFEVNHKDFWVSRKLRGKVTFFVNGFFSDYKSDKNSNQTVYGLLNTIEFDTDVILVDYFHGDVFRDQAVANTRVIGAMIGQFVSDLRIVQKTVCIGFSIGAHICGFAGQWLLGHRDQILPSCIGIDPSGPGYEGCPNDKKLSIGDCGVISILHGSYFPTQGSIYGNQEKSGNCDFYVNYKLREPGCPTTDSKDFINSISRLSFDDFVSGIKFQVACDHLRTYELFNSLLSKGILLKATKCLGNLDNSPNTKFLPPFNRCKSGDDISYCLDINRIP